jgi:glycosyltransferase involved in cell wall biosynthesis
MSSLHKTYARSKRFPQSLYHNITSAYLKIYEKGQYPKYDAVVFYSERDRRETGLPDNLPQAVIGNGVDTNHFAAMPRPANPIPVLTFHGYLGHYPNMEGAMFLITEIGPYLESILGADGFRLRIIGSDPKGILLKYKTQHQWLDLPGYSQDLPSALNQADIYVAPIFSGAGIKNKVLEAFSMGLPVIGTREAFAALEVANDKHCIICSKEDFGKKIIEVMNSEQIRRSLASHARIYVKRRFSWNLVANTYLSLYQECLSKTDPIHAKAINAIPPR